MPAPQPPVCHPYWQVNCCQAVVETDGRDEEGRPIFVELDGFAMDGAPIWESARDSTGRIVVQAQPTGPPRRVFQTWTPGWRCRGCARFAALDSLPRPPASTPAGRGLALLNL